MHLVRFPRLWTAHHRNSIKHDKNLTGVKPFLRSSVHSPFVLKSSPTSHLQFLCEVDPLGAVLPSGQGMQSTEVSFLKWSGGHISHWVPWPCLSFPMLLHVAHDIPAHLMIHDAPKEFALEFLQIGTRLNIKLRKASNILIKIFAA